VISEALMPTDPLTRYLQEHLAGSVAALQLMETLADHERGLPLEQKLRGLHAEVTEEQERLKAILARLEGEESSLKQAAAWLTEKLHRGRLALYRALEDVAPDEPRLGGYPFAALQARTMLQHAMVEQERMAAVRVAFGGEGGSNGRDSENASSGGDSEGGSGDWGDSDA
jgi:hypothetical protein